MVVLVSRAVDYAFYLTIRWATSEPSARAWMGKIGTTTVGRRPATKAGEGAPGGKDADRWRSIVSTARAAATATRPRTATAGLAAPPWRVAGSSPAGRRAARPRRGAPCCPPSSSPSAGRWRWAWRPWRPRPVWLGCAAGPGGYDRPPLPAAKGTEPAIPKHPVYRSFEEVYAWVKEGGFESRMFAQRTVESFRATPPTDKYR